MIQWDYFKTFFRDSYGLDLNFLILIRIGSRFSETPLKTKWCKNQILPSIFNFFSNKHSGWKSNGFGQLDICFNIFQEFLKQVLDFFKTFPVTLKSRRDPSRLLQSSVRLFRDFFRFYLFIYRWFEGLIANELSLSEYMAYLYYCC